MGRRNMVSWRRTLGSDASIQSLGETRVDHARPCHRMQRCLNGSAEPVDDNLSTNCCAHRLYVAIHNHREYRQCNALLPTRLYAFRKEGSLFSAKSNEEKPNNEAWDAQEQFYKDLKKRQRYAEDLHDSGQKQLLKPRTRSTWC